MSDENPIKNTWYPPQDVRGSARYDLKYFSDYGLKRPPRTSGLLRSVVAARDFVEGLSMYAKVRQMLCEEIQIGLIALYIKNEWQEGEHISHPSLTRYLQYYRQYFLTETDFVSRTGGKSVISDESNETSAPESVVVDLEQASVDSPVEPSAEDGNCQAAQSDTSECSSESVSAENKHVEQEQQSANIIIPEIIKNKISELLGGEFTSSGETIMEIRHLEQMVQMQMSRINTAREKEGKLDGYLMTGLRKEFELLAELLKTSQTMKSDLGMPGYRRAAKQLDLNIPAGSRPIDRLTQGDMVVLNEFAKLLEPMSDERQLDEIAVDGNVADMAIDNTADDGELS